MSQNRVILDTDLCFKLEWDWSSSISVRQYTSHPSPTHCVRAPFERVGDKWEKVTYTLDSHLLSAYSTINRSRHVSIKTADSELRTSHARFATFIGIDIDSSLLSLLKLSLVNSNP